MCGFLLIACTEPGARLPHGERELDRLRDVLRSRGPDAGETRILADGSLALTHRRLKVLDLAGSRQPMRDAEGRYHLLFNGEIYNYRELRPELESLGWSFRTAGDTEVLLAAWSVWGADCLDRLNGMFAFAIFDERERRLHLARDHMGVKPLCYGRWGGLFYAASEAKAIVADPRVPRRIDPEALDLYFHHGYVPAPWAIWEGMHKLQAAHRLTLELARPLDQLPAQQRYWDIPVGRDALDETDERTLLDRLDRTLQTAVERQTVSDVPLGAFLSGGVDSTLVVSYLAECSDHPVQTFSVGYANQRFDERPWARRVSRRYGTEHHEIVLDEDALELLPQLAQDYDEPFADPAALPLAAVSRLAREHVTVALSGDGGDETHAGYPRYLDARRIAWLDAVPLAARRTALGPLARLVPSWKRRGLLEMASRDATDRYDAMTAEVPWEHRQAVYGEAMREALSAGRIGNPGPGASAWRRGLEGRLHERVATVDRFQYVDLTSYLPEKLLVKTDRASMRVSLEARVPLLDRDAVELAARIPAAWRVRDRRPKYLLRRLVERHMGHEFANRRKHGFRVPEVEWFRSLPRARLEESLSSDGIEAWVDPQRLRRFLLDSPRGLEFFWPFLTFALWHRCYMTAGALA